MDPAGLPAAGLSWSLLGRFADYVRGSGGSIVAGDGAIVESSGMASWPLADASGFDGEAGILRFAGVVRFTAHFGALDLALRDPVLEVADGRAGLAVLGGDGVPQPFASSGWRAVGSIPGRRAWVGEGVTLDARATVHFGGVYAPGTPLDPLVVVLEGVPND